MLWAIYGYRMFIISCHSHRRHQNWQHGGKCTCNSLVTFVVWQKSPDYCYNALKNENNFVIDTNLVVFFLDINIQFDQLVLLQRIIQMFELFTILFDTKMAPIHDTAANFLTQFSVCIDPLESFMDPCTHFHQCSWLFVVNSLFKLPQKRSPLGWGQEIWQANLPFLCVRSIQMATLHQGRFGRRMRNGEELHPVAVAPC